MELVVKRYLSEPISHWYTTNWADKLRTYSHISRSLSMRLLDIYKEFTNMLRVP